MRYRRPTRLRGFSYIGFYRYHLRFSTNGDRLFAKRDLVDAALLEIRRTAGDEGFALLAYCFMPGHLHLLVEGERESSDLRRFARLSKQRVSYVHRTQFRIATTWQDGYFERVLRAEEATEVVVRYVLDNPVRAGLVTLAEDYPFSGALYWPT